VEGIYGVKVTDVKIINVPRKKRRVRGQIGWKKGYKKAIVQVKEGQKIEILPR
jgi:large subunit ribosomal protein L23